MLVVQRFTDRPYIRTCTHTQLGVAANADTPEDARVALQYGAVGIGLCRTEHMFFQPDRIDHMREMILAETEAERQKALDILFEYQKARLCVFGFCLAHLCVLGLSTPKPSR